MAAYCRMEMECNVIYVQFFFYCARNALLICNSVSVAMLTKRICLKGVFAKEAEKC